MSLSRRQQRLLNRIDDAESRSAPRLAGMLAVFARLTAGEPMPRREELRTKPVGNSGGSPLPPDPGPDTSGSPLPPGSAAQPSAAGQPRPARSQPGRMPRWLRPHLGR